jgi:hypothetical protein
VTRSTRELKKRRVLSYVYNLANTSFSFNLLQTQSNLVKHGTTRTRSRKVRSVVKNRRESSDRLLQTRLARACRSKGLYRENAIDCCGCNCVSLYVNVCAKELVKQENCVDIVPEQSGSIRKPAVPYDRLIFDFLQRTPPHDAAGRLRRDTSLTFRTKTGEKNA